MPFFELCFRSFAPTDLPSCESGCCRPSIAALWSWSALSVRTTVQRFNSSGQPQQPRRISTLRTLQPSIYLAYRFYRRFQRNAVRLTCTASKPAKKRSQISEELTSWARICKAKDAHGCARFWTSITAHGRAPLPTHGPLRLATVPQYRLFSVARHWTGQCPG